MKPQPISYDPADLEVLAGLEERHFWFRARRRIIVEALTGTSDEAGPDRLLQRSRELTRCFPLYPSLGA